MSRLERTLRAHPHDTALGARYAELALRAVHLHKRAADRDWPHGALKVLVAASKRAARSAWRYDCAVRNRESRAASAVAMTELARSKDVFCAVRYAVFCIATAAAGGADEDAAFEAWSRLESTWLRRRRAEWSELAELERALTQQQQQQQQQPRP